MGGGILFLFWDGRVEARGWSPAAGVARLLSLSLALCLPALVLALRGAVVPATALPLAAAAAVAAVGVGPGDGVDVDGAKLECGLLVERRWPVATTWRRVCEYAWWWVAVLWSARRKRQDFYILYMASGRCRHWSDDESP